MENHAVVSKTYVGRVQRRRNVSFLSLFCGLTKTKRPRSATAQGQLTVPMRQSSSLLHELGDHSHCFVNTTIGILSAKLAGVIVAEIVVDIWVCSAHAEDSIDGKSRGCIENVCRACATPSQRFFFVALLWIDKNEASTLGHSTRTPYCPHAAIIFSSTRTR